MPPTEFRMSAIDVLESVPDVVCVADRDRRLTWWNERLRTVTGFTDETLSNSRVTDLVVAEDRDVVREAFERLSDSSAQHGSPEHSSPQQGSKEGATAQRGSSEHTIAVDVRTADGSRVPHEFSGHVFQRGGEVAIVCIGRELTGRNKRETEVRRQRDELETLNRISKTVHGVIYAVIDAADRDELEAAVCERLAASDLYRSVWIGRNEPNSAITPDVGTSPTADFLADVTSFNDFDWERPARTALETGSVQTVRGIADAELPNEIKEISNRWDIHSGIAVPISYRDNVFGVLVVYSSRPDAFSEYEHSAFARLGEIIGFGIHLVQTQRMVLAETATELTFRTEDDETLLGELSNEATGECTYEWSQATNSGPLRHLITVHGLEPDRVLEVASNRSDVEDISLVSGDGDKGIFEFVIEDPLIEQFFEVGAVLTSIVARDGVATITVEVPGSTDLRRMVELVKSRYEATLLSKRELDRPVRTAGEYWKTVTDHLTDRQQATLRQAYLRGYFSWPRDATAEEIAGAMDVSSPTFHYHIRNAQRALVEAYFETLED